MSALRPCPALKTGKVLFRVFILERSEESHVAGEETPQPAWGRADAKAFALHLQSPPSRTARFSLIHEASQPEREASASATPRLAA